MRCTDPAVAAVALMCLATIPVRAAAAQPLSFNVPPGSVGATAVAIGAQAGATIGVADPDLARLPAPGVRGRYSLKQALDRGLRGTGAGYAFIDAMTVRVFRLPLRPARPAPPPPPLRRSLSPTVAPTPLQGDDIIVSAAKQSTTRDRLPASVEIFDLTQARLSRTAALGLDGVIAQLPALTSTGLGPGRNKLFIRGVADSSFNGSAQATVGQYLGDARLNFNAPDPDLNLYDMRRVEVLVGPQGTLYGTGSIGGVIRLLPNDPDPAALAGTAATGVSQTRFGGTGVDLAAMVNVPLGSKGSAVRAVAYRSVEAGYIDDPERSLKDINRTTSYGGRATLRLEDVAGWRLDMGVVIQNIASRDGQYTLRGEPDLTRRSAIAQPFDNDYRLGYVTARRDFGDMELVSTTSAVRQDLETVYDATGSDGTANPARFTEDVQITLVSQETRLSGGSANASWLVGIGALYNVNRLTRTLGDLGTPTPVLGVRNETDELAAFGRYSLRILPRLTATVGGRVTYGRSVARLLDIVPGGQTNDQLQGRIDAVRLSPSFALGWQVTPSIFGFTRFETASRASGLAAITSTDASASRRFGADHVGLVEAGGRYGRKGLDALSAAVSLSYVRWRNVQADLIDANGLPFTANIGNGRIFGLDASIGWRVTPAVTLEGAVFYNDSALFTPSTLGLPDDTRNLPDIAEHGARIGVTWHYPLTSALDLSLEASARYVGKSQLGVGAPLDVAQGNYGVGDVGARLVYRHIGLSLDVTNIADVRGNRFAFGNPFGLAGRNEITPLRPRSVRLGVDANF